MIPNDLILIVLQMLRLKGRVGAQDFAANEKALLDGLTAEGLVQEVKGSMRITPAGRSRLAELVDQERAGVDAAAVADAYEAFTALNSDFKALITAWQIRDGAPNDHTDAEYDGNVIAELARIHARLLPFLDRLIALVPRLANYVGRFDRALKNVTAGDYTWLARPIMDSYHTVWFELHEELIGLAGHTREAEAAAGRAA